MLKRKIYDELLKWKKDKNHKALLLKGARQVGKTFIINEFGRNEYKSYIYINFLENSKYEEIFSENLEPDNIYKQISARVNDVKYIEGDTLIFFDEIQECPKARTALKFLSEDKKYDIIASGSLLGIRYKEQEEKTFSIPVGYEKDLEMYSLDFEEFLWAKGVNEDAIEYFKKSFEKRQKFSNDLIIKYNNYFKEYMVVGGMPEVVKIFLDTNNFQDASKKQKEILNNYHDDIVRYATTTMKQKINNCYNSIPMQLSKNYTKFQYGKVEHKATNKKYESSIEWLCDAGMTKKCKNVSVPLFPLKGYEIITEFKLYVTDIGLLTNMFGFETQSAIVTNSIRSTAKGGIFENAIYVELIKRYEKVYYFKKKDNSQEIEFLIENNAEVVPIEVKSKNGTTISLNNYINEFLPKVAYKIIDGNIGISDNKITVPLFMVMFI